MDGRDSKSSQLLASLLAQLLTGQCCTVHRVRSAASKVLGKLAARKSESLEGTNFSSFDTGATSDSHL